MKMVRAGKSLFFINKLLLGDYNPGAKNDGGNEEEEYKGADLAQLPEKQYVPSLYDDENFDFKVVKPQL